MLANISLIFPVALLAVVLNAMLPVILGTEIGNHDTLMKKKGLYRKLVDLQTEAANWKLNM